MNIDFELSKGIIANALVGYLVIIDPLGVALIFNALTERESASYCRRAALRAVALSCVVVLGFGFFGATLLDHLGITMNSFRIAGGVMLFYTAFKMIVDPEKSAEDDPKPKDIAVYPLCFPFIAGPGCLTLTVLLFSQSSQVQGGLVAITLAVMIVFVVVALCLLMSKKIGRVVGPTADAIICRLLGVLLASLSVQFIADGIVGIMGQTTG